jgi:hypothetical protein
MTVEPVTHVLDALAAPYALIGAHAMAARGYPRFTVDIDLLTTDSRVLHRSTWSGLSEGGVSVDARRGDEDDPLAGVVHFLLPDATEIDLVVGRWEWERDVIERAERMLVLGTTLAIPRTSDLILLKLAAGGHLDLHDAAALLAVGDRDQVEREIEAHIGDVRPDVRSLWRELQDKH